MASTSPGQQPAAPGLEHGDPSIVFTQVPAGAPDAMTPAATTILPPPLGAGGRILLKVGDREPRLLTGAFHSACDPDVSFDARTILFAARRRAQDPWNIYEMGLDGTEARQITRDAGNCRHPVYLGRFYAIVADQPWEQIAFVSDRAGELDEAGAGASTSLYACRLDGTDLQRLTYNPSSDLTPTVLPDGRLLFASWQRRSLARGPLGRIALFAAQTDGLDYALFCGDQGDRIKLMPCVTTDRQVVFVETDRVTRDGGGRLASVSLRRNLHSYRSITDASDGVFHAPAPWPGGRVLVARRPADGGTYGIVRLDPGTGRSEPVLDDPAFHDIQARHVAARPRPDGRSSVVSERFETGVFYCLDVYESALPEGTWVKRGTPLRLRVLEGIPRRALPQAHRPGPAAGQGARDLGHGEQDLAPAPLLRRRVLGEIDVAQDGSFSIEVPADIPVELQLLDADGLALRSCGWIWVRRRETRGCIGCHEDGERVPANRFVDALERRPVPLTLPPERRRSVDFRNQLLPIVTNRCAAVACHGGADAACRLEGIGPGTAAGGPPSVDAPRVFAGLLDGSRAGPGEPAPAGRHVHPGRARTSPLTWHVFGRNTARPWDVRDGGPGPGHAPQALAGAALLADDEKRTVAEWIDLGAMWDACPTEPAQVPSPRAKAGGVR